MVFSKRPLNLMAFGLPGCIGHQFLGSACGIYIFIMCKISAAHPQCQTQKGNKAWLRSPLAFQKACLRPEFFVEMGMNSNETKVLIRWSCAARCQKTFANVLNHGLRPQVLTFFNRCKLTCILGYWLIIERVIKMVSLSNTPAGQHEPYERLVGWKSEVAYH